MKISLNWLRDFVDIDELDEKTLIDNLTVMTCELEGVEYKGNDISNLVVGKVLECDSHPNSDHLHLLKVDVGNEILDIVCGAPNVKKGVKVVVVKVGGTLPGMKIKERLVAGYKSQGMCCSEEELGLNVESEGIIILDDSIEVGSDAIKLLGLKDVVLEIDNKSLTNRPDLWGHYGFAREVACILKKPLKSIASVDLMNFNDLPKLNVKVESENCYRYSAIKVENVNIHESDYKTKVRLFYCGMRPINLLADLTNYVMLELGQPMHAFDGKKVNEIIVKDLISPTSFMTLDKIEKKLPQGSTVICNKDDVVAVAGVMGGLDSEITDDTNSILLESANFYAKAVRLCANAIGTRTDSSNRYEKTLDPELCEIATARYLYLLKNIDTNIKVVSSYTDIYKKHYDKIVIDISKKFIDDYIGEVINESQIIDILTRLGFKIQNNNHNYKIFVPSFRATKDISNKSDIVEEVARMYGYNKIQPKSNMMPVTPTAINIFHEDMMNAKKYLCNRFSYSEVHSNIWQKRALIKELKLNVDKNVQILNSISGDNELRSNMIITLLDAVIINKQDFDNINIFEIGEVFNGFDEKNQVVENTHLCMVKASKSQDSKTLYKELAKEIKELVFELKSVEVKFVDNSKVKDYMHPVENMQIIVNNTELGVISIVHPRVENIIDKKLSIAFLEVDFGKLSNIKKSEIKMSAVSKFPSTDVDLSFVCDEDIPYQKLKDIISSMHYKFLKKYKLIETYKDKEKLGNKKSITIRFVLCANNKTLSADDVKIFTDRVIKELSKSNIEFRY